MWTVNDNKECDVLKLGGKNKVLPGGDGNLGQAVEQHSGGQADKRHHGAVQEFQLPHQDVGCLSTRRDLLHEVEVNL